MDYVYPVSYLISLTGLVGWFLFQHEKSLSRRLSAMFLVGFLAYLVALSMASAELNYKLLILFRDLLVLALVSQVFNVLRKSILLSAAMALAAGLIVYFSYFNVLACTFPQLDTDRMSVEGEFLVQIDRNVLADPQALADRWNCDVDVAFAPAASDITELDDYYLVNVRKDSKRARKRLYQRLSKAKGIKWVEPNEYVQLEEPLAAEPPTDARDVVLNDPGIRFQWAWDPLETDKLQRFLLESGVKPRKKARVVIIDTGVDASHEDLKDAYRSIKPSHDNDKHGHGTHCAGIAGAVSNNGVGIASLGPSTDFVELSGIKVLNSFGAGTQQMVIKGIIEATDAGADVISVSLGGPTQRKKEKAYKKAIDYALDHNAVVVVAAGNSSQSAARTTPANIPGVIAVAATDKDNNKAFFSNTVEDLAMGIAAPGVEIYSTVPGSNYRAMSGTSMATPMVAGLVGLLKSFNPELSAEDVFLILDNTGKKIESSALTGRLIQPYDAIMALMD